MTNELPALQFAVPVHSTEQLGIPEALLTDLVLRRMLVDVKTSIKQLATTIGVTTGVAESIARELRDRKLVDFERMIGLDWVLALTEAGRRSAVDSMQRVSYIGHAPISLPRYKDIVIAQRARPNLCADSVRRAFHDIVIGDATIADVGPAMMSQGAIFLYGPPGTGKSTIAERLTRLLGDPVLIPRAVEVDGQIITVFDPAVHLPIDPQPDIDRRLVLCQRPCIVVGGELVRSQLDLTYDPASGLHLAPVQMKSNNGMLVIDDFGRQSMTPAELLNRWIVPLDRGVDYLTLTYGVRFDVPFEARIAFSTNLEPATLGDEAFFRRLPNKIYVGSITPAQFDEILYIVAQKKGIGLRAEDAEYLRSLVVRQGDGDLRPYVPAVACDIAMAICRFEGRPLRFTRDLLDRVAATYFTRSMSSGRATAESRALTQEATVSHVVPPPEDGHGPSRRISEWDKPYVADNPSDWDGHTPPVASEYATAEMQPF